MHRFAVEMAVHI
jgi:hypothetical protein